MAKPDMEAIERRLARATPGPWRRGIGNDSRVVFGPKDVIVVPTVGAENGSLIADAPEDLVALIDYAQTLEAQNEKLRAALANNQWQSVDRSQGVEGSWCIGCGNWVEKGCSKTCEVAQALKETEDGRTT